MRGPTPSDSDSSDEDLNSSTSSTPDNRRSKRAQARSLRVAQDVLDAEQGLLSSASLPFNCITPVAYATLPPLQRLRHLKVLTRVLFETYLRFLLLFCFESLSPHPLTLPSPDMKSAAPRPVANRLRKPENAWLELQLNRLVELLQYKMPNCVLNSMADYHGKELAELKAPEHIHSLEVLRGEVLKDEEFDLFTQEVTMRDLALERHMTAEFNLLMQVMLLLIRLRIADECAHLVREKFGVSQHQDGKKGAELFFRNTFERNLLNESDLRNGVVRGGPGGGRLSSIFDDSSLDSEMNDPSYVPDARESAYKTVRGGLSPKFILPEKIAGSEDFYQVRHSQRHCRCRCQILRRRSCFSLSFFTPTLSILISLRFTSRLLRFSSSHVR